MPRDCVFVTTMYELGSGLSTNTLYSQPYFSKHRAVCSLCMRMFTNLSAIGPLKDGSYFSGSPVNKRSNDTYSFSIMIYTKNKQLHSLIMVKYSLI